MPVTSVTAWGEQNVYGNGMAPQLQQSGVLVLAVFLAVLAERGWQWLRRRKARSWPLTQGRVHSADWRKPRTGTNRYFLADVSYYYFVDGHFYAGYHRRSFSSAAAAARWVQELHGAGVQIRYQPGAPWRSMLLEGDLAILGAPAVEALPSR